METHPKDLSPLSFSDGCPHDLLKEKACLCLWEVPYHLDLKEVNAKPCNGTTGNEHAQACERHPPEVKIPTVGQPGDEAVL